MVSNTLKTLGRNITFPIYNADGTSFHGLEMKKSTVESVVMSLGDKITGDVYYKDNTLAVTMSEYIEYNANPDDENEEPVHYILVNPPTIVREGMVSDNSELKGMTKYSFEFYHPMYQLGNFPFTDVATTSDEEKYLSEKKSFSWIGKPQDFIDKLNKNLQGTAWYVRKSNRFPVEKDDELSEVQQFDKISVAEAIKKGYEIWEIPYIVSQLPSNDPLYAQGKRFVVEYGLPSNEIYENESARQLDTPFVFHMGQGVGLKNNSRTPRNNKIVTRIAGFGSEDNIPYGYPQIIWTGNQDWKYTINNDANNPLSYPIYSGIVGGRYVKLIKHPFTRSHLMPSIFSETVNKKVNPNAEGYNPNIEIKDYYDAVATQEYPYTNEINLQAPSYENHEFEDIKPELDSERNTGIISATPLNNDLTPADHWDDEIDDNGSYIQSYFKIKLPQLSFDLYACAAITQEMKVNMRSGSCIGCTFTVSVDWDDYKKNFYDADGNFAPDGSQRKLDKYPKSNLGEIEIILQKDNNTFGKIMPNVYQQPNSGDLFVFIGISLPTSYIKEAEERLDDAMKSYMLENNVYYFDYPLKFDEYFLATHKYILGQIHPNSIIHFDYGGEELQLFVKQLTVKYGNNPLPQYEITLTDNIEITLNQIGQVASDVEKLSSLISILRQTYSRNVWAEIAKKLSKTQDDTAQGFLKFLKGFQVGKDFTSGTLGEGGVFRKDADGKTYIEADRMYVRMKAYFDNVEIKDYHHAQGNRMVTSAGIKITRVEDKGSYYRCYFRASDGDNTISNDFVIGDMAYCNVTNIIDGELSQHSYWRLVIGKDSTPTDDEHYIDLSKAGGTNIGGVIYAGYMFGSDKPLAQDDVIQLGNVNDSTRRGAIIEYASGADSPSYKIYQDIGNIGNAATISAKRKAQYTLDGKEMVSLGYNSQTAKAYMNVYGDTFIGDHNGSSFIRYNSQNKELEIKAKIEATSTVGNQSLSEYIKSNQNNFDDSELLSAIQGLQEQIDGEIDTWFFNVNPSDTTEPELTWKNTDTANNNNAERLKHLGDIYYNNSNGYAWRYSNTGTESNPVFSWVEISDSAVIRALTNAAAAQETADSKITIYTSWNAWVVSGSSKLRVKDLFIPTQDTTQGGTTYKANKVYRCTNASTPAFVEVAYTDDTKINSYINEIIHGTATSGSDLIKAAAAQRAIMGALNEGTVVDGGLVLTSLIGLRQKSGNNHIMWAGISGQYNSTPSGQTGYAKGNGIAAWYGGSMVDKEMLTDAQIEEGWNTHRWARSLFRFDGSGYISDGNISWDKDGGMTIQNITSLYDNNKELMNLNKLTELTNIFHTTLGAPNNTLYILPQNAFSEIKIVHPSAYTIEGTDVLNMNEMDDRYLTKEIFYKIFAPVFGTNGNLENLQVRGGLWTNSYISALGQNSSQGGGSGTSYNRLDTWASYDSTKSGWVLSALLGNDLNTRLTVLENGVAPISHTHAWSDITGKPTTLSGYGITDAYISNGVITLGTNTITPITSLAGYATESWVGSNYSPKSHTHSIKINGVTKTIDATGGTAVDLGSYLPLNGGTMTERIIFNKPQQGAVQYLQWDPNNDDKNSTGCNWYGLGICLDNSRPILNISNYFGINITTSSNSKLLLNGNIVWNAGNDGSGSGLDADLLDGYHAEDISKVWYTLQQYFDGSTAPRWYKICAKTSTTLDDIENDWMIEISAYGDRNYASHIHGYLRATYYQNVAIVLSTNPACNVGTALQLRATVDSNGDVWLGVIANYSGRLCFRVLHEGANNHVIRSGWTMQRKDPSDTYIVNNGALSPAHIQGVQKMYLPNVVSDYAGKLDTSRTIWGQSFDGSANVSGAMSGVTNINSLLYLGTNVGIGVSNPTEKLDVVGNVRVSCNGGEGLRIKNLDGKYSAIRFADSTGTDKAEIHYFHADMWNNPSANTLNLQSPIVSLGYWEKPTVYVNSDNKFVGIGTGNPSHTLDVNGTVHATAGIYSEGYVSALGQNTSSDARLKDVQGDICLPIDVLSNAPSKAFTWKENKALGEQVGTIAQYWQKALPQVVHDNNGYLAMQYDVAALLGVISVAKEVKSHEERIAELEIEIEMLNQELKTLKN